MMQTQVPPVCPHCGQADEVRPISAVFTEEAVGGPAASANSGAPPQIAAETRQQLAPPVVPALPQKSDFPAAKYRQSSRQTTHSFGAWLDTGLIVVWLILSVLAFVLVAQIDEDLVEFLGTGIALVLILIVYGFRQLVLKKLPIAGLRDYYRRDAQEDADADQRAQAAYAAALAAYEQSRSTEAKWHDLFYCARCNGVFAPTERAFVPAAGLSAYLSQTPAVAATPSIS